MSNSVALSTIKMPMANNRGVLTTSAISPNSKNIAHVDKENAHASPKKVLAAVAASPNKADVDKNRKMRVLLATKIAENESLKKAKEAAILQVGVLETQDKTSQLVLAALKSDLTASKDRVIQLETQSKAKQRKSLGGRSLTLAVSESLALRTQIAETALSQSIERQEKVDQEVERQAFISGNVYKQFVSMEMERDQAISERDQAQELLQARDQEQSEIMDMVKTMRQEDAEMEEQQKQMFEEMQQEMTEAMRVAVDAEADAGVEAKKSNELQEQLSLKEPVHKILKEQVKKLTLKLLQIETSHAAAQSEKSHMAQANQRKVMQALDERDALRLHNATLKEERLESQQKLTQMVSSLVKIEEHVSKTDALQNAAAARLRSQLHSQSRDLASSLSKMVLVEDMNSTLSDHNLELTERVGHLVVANNGRKDKLRNAFCTLGETQALLATSSARLETQALLATSKAVESKHKTHTLETRIEVLAKAFQSKCQAVVVYQEKCTATEAGYDSARSLVLVLAFVLFMSSLVFTFVNAFQC